MDLDTAKRHIQTAFDRMRVAYLDKVFDEWAILAVTGKTGGVVAYHGARADEFVRNLPRDTEPLRKATAGKKLTEGDIEFVPDAVAELHDAFMKVGPSSFLVLNHTGKSMEEIRANSRWLGAQKILFELSEKFRADPLEL